MDLFRRQASGVFPGMWASRTNIIPSNYYIHHFHGNEVRVMKKREGVWTQVWSAEAPFAHAICRGEICGRPSAVFGARNGERELFVLRWDPDRKEFKKVLLDAGCGPANVMLYRKDGKDVLLVANRENDEVAVYTLSEE